MAKIKLQMRATIEETFKDFIVSKRSKGLAEKTLESYQFHFHSIEKHLDVTQDVAALQKEDLEMMIAEMRGAGLAANSILSYTRTLKSFFSWCNAEGISTLNIPLYKGEETVKETYTDNELAALAIENVDTKTATERVNTITQKTSDRLVGITVLSDAYAMEWKYNNKKNNQTVSKHLRADVVQRRFPVQACK